MKILKLNITSKRTDNKIRQAFAELMREKGSMGNISVTELTKRASITRSSFYNHYNNVAEVGSTFREELLEEFFQNFKTIQTVADLDEFFDRITLYLKEHDPIYHMLISSQDAYYFMEHLTRKITQNLELAMRYQSQPDSKMQINFFVNGAISLIIQHFQGKNNFSLDEINTYLKQVAHKIFVSIH